MRTTQILNAVSEISNHQTYPFPFTFGKLTVHRCWVQTGNSNPNISRRSSFKQHFWYTVWNPLSKLWLAPKRKFAADIILIYIPNEQYHEQFGLACTVSLDFNTCTTLADIYAFIFPTTHTNEPPPIPPILPVRYFNNAQRAILCTALLKLGETKSNITALNTMWPEPTDHTQASALAVANTNIGTMQMTDSIAAAFQAKVKKLPESLQSRFFRLHTKFDFSPETDGKGWPNPQALKDRELQDLDEKGKTRQETIDRWARWDLIYAHWDNPQALATVPDADRLFLPGTVQSTIDHMVDILKQANDQQAQPA